MPRYLLAVNAPPHAHSQQIDRHARYTSTLHCALLCSFEGCATKKSGPFRTRVRSVPPPLLPLLLPLPLVLALPPTLALPLAPELPPFGLLPFGLLPFGLLLLPLAPHPLLPLPLLLLLVLPALPLPPPLQRHEPPSSAARSASLSCHFLLRLC